MEQMNPSAHSKRQTPWIYISCYVVIIFLTLPLTPLMVSRIAKYLPVEQFVNAGLVLFAVICLMLTLKASSHRPVRTVALFLLLTVITVIALQRIRLPIERIHIAEYGLLSVLLFRALHADHKRVPALFWSLLASIVLGAMDEGLQYALPNRHFSLPDIILNAVGSLAGLCYYGMYIWIAAGRNTRERNPIA